MWFLRRFMSEDGSCFVNILGNGETDIEFRLGVIPFEMDAAENLSFAVNCDVIVLF